MNSPSKTLSELKAITKRQRRILAVQRQNLVLDMLEVSFTRKVAQIINRYVNRTATDVSKLGAQIDIRMSMTGMVEDMQKALEAQYRKTTSRFGRMFFDSVRKSSIPLMAERKDATGIFEASINSYIAEFAAERAVQITNTTRTMIVGAIEQAISDQLGTAGMARLIRDKSGGTISLSRAKTIARTETHTAAQYAQQTASEATDIQFRKIWVPIDDDLTRPSHHEAGLHSEDNVIMNEDVFNVGGYPARFPGDPMLPPGESINCRCGVAREPIFEDDDD